MSRKAFRKNMNALEDDLIITGDMVSEAINNSVKALKEGNVDNARKIIADDSLINKKRWEIEEVCVRLFATQQPVATDLRELITVLNIITDLERMGDHAEGIAKIVLMHEGQPLVKPLVQIPQMAEKAVDMLKKSLEAFANRDDKTARALCNEDDKVDEIYEHVYRELLKIMIEDPKTITRATYLIWAAHNLERIADRVTNICERIVYLVTGKMEEMNVSNY
ncbi:MAG: phosphate signaling complex protein PhoU [Candidatus Scalindua sp.]|nr:phosphate signaling complex protein PhoU [Candidatus Scalindua sp.]